MRLERDMGIAVETLAVFVRFWVTATPALPEPAAQAARAKANERYEAFITALGRRLAKGPKLRQEVLAVENALYRSSALGQSKTKGTHGRSIARSYLGRGCQSFSRSHNPF